MPDGDGSSSTKTRIKVLSREVKLTYLQSQQIRGGARDVGDLAGEGGGVGSVTTGSSKPGSSGFLGIGGSGASSQSSQSSDSGWIISRTWEETSFDKVRYGIGVRDVGVFNYKFAPVSEIVSKVWKAPRPISKVQLEVVEQIPARYPLGTSYIEYWISPNGQDWHRIIPLNHPTLVDDSGDPIPKTITFNSDVAGEAAELNKFVTTAEPVAGVRLRVVLRASQEVDEPERHTPILKSYRLKLFPVGGLRE